MSIRIALRHHTRYDYDRPVIIDPQIVRLRPAPHCRTPILAYSLKIQPEDHFLNWQQDPFGNFLARLVFNEPAEFLQIDVDLVARMTQINPFDFFLEERTETFPFTYTEEEKSHLAPYLVKDEPGPLLTEWLAGVDLSEKRTIDFLVEFNQQLERDITYGIRMEPGVQTPEETLKLRAGSCRDTGWLAVQAFRNVGLAARFVSGYLVQLAPDQESLDGPSGPTEDVTDLHAWVEVYVPGAGWIGMDPTSGLFAGAGHIPLACTPEPTAAAAITGKLNTPCKSEMTFLNQVDRIYETPRVTKPYTDAQWAEIDALGHSVDQALEAGDVRLTMGGEPTFVSIDDMDGAEWNTAADGEHKRERAEELLRRIYKKFGQKGLIYYGEGKWYPGEPLPRWAWNIYWRKDGEAVWANPELLANPQEDHKLGIAQAKEFAEEIAKRLHGASGVPIPAYEDSIYYLWKEGQIPLDDDPLRKDLKDPLERQYLANLLDEGLGEVQGYVIPVEWDRGKETWKARSWPFRREHLFLEPGGSPVGFRLPLESITKEPLPHKIEPSPLDADGELPSREELGKQKQAPPVKRDEPITRLALCVEPRNGNLWIFFPPAESLEAYLYLLRQVEIVAEKLKLPVVIEGYEPPTDPRLTDIKVTPDPGVIEVNINPSKTWDELRDKTLTLYEEARLARLGTEKFMLDGRHSGTGGGNHITLGGITPAESPFLRNPGLLRSFVTYWQHHPALSYLFSGLFIGPTSQAPRVDEGRDDKIYELEIAFSQLPKEEGAPPWIADRVLRNLLTDLTGNTHRAEFCIDKLYSPDRQSGRLGLVELRAFEMPPHAQMSLVQTLLVRALVARFWNRPYHKRLVRWGTTLHDKFLLPHYVWEDMREVCEDLEREGFPVKLNWFAPFWEFRFPLFGAVLHEGVEMELRLAIEPWHVLGEEATSQGTARYVDSSVERVEVKLKGMTDERYVLLCNGRRVELTPTGKRGEYVAGIRYKAWSPWSAMHPTIDVHTPLVFDLADTWNERSVGGFTYFVSHPGGRSYDTFPVNLYEAESRRTSRFWEMGHTPGIIEKGPVQGNTQRTMESHQTPKSWTGLPEREVQSDDFPHTFDLRFGL